MKLKNMKKTAIALTAALSLLLSAAAPAFASELPDDALAGEGILSEEITDTASDLFTGELPEDGFIEDGFSNNVFSGDGFSNEGFPEDEFFEDGVSNEGFPEDAFSEDDFSENDFSDEGLPEDGSSEDDFLSENLNAEDGLTDGYSEGDTLADGYSDGDTLTDGLSADGSMAFLDLDEEDLSDADAAAGHTSEGKDDEEDQLLIPDPDEPEVIFEEIEEEEVLEEGYDPTVTPDGNTGGAGKLRSMRKGASGGGSISNFTTLRDQMDPFSQYVYDRMVDLYITRGLMGTTTATDTNGNSVPAEKTSINYAAASSYGITFPATIYVGTDGKNHVDTSTDEYKAAYANYTYLIQSAIDAFTYDHPEVYWYRPNGYKSGYSASSVTTDGETSYIGYFSSFTLLMRQTFTGAYDLRETFDTQVETVSSQLAATSDYDGDGAVSTLEYIQASHDYIIRRAYYDHDSLATYMTTGDYRIFSAAGLFLDSAGNGVVCEGYSKAMKVLMDAQGIGCALIPGVVDSSQEGHMWNCIDLNGSWYLTDVTWDDKGDEPGTSQFYRYYLVPAITGRTTSYRISDPAKANAQNFSWPAVAAVPNHTFVQTACVPFSKYSCSDEDGVAYWLPATAHSLTLVSECEPCCEENGHIAYYYCSICGKYFADSEGSEELSAQQIIEFATGHTLVKTDRVPATCEEAGNIEYYTCSVCQNIFSDAVGQNKITQADTIIAAAGHTIVRIAEKAPGCEIAGNIGHYTCTACGKLFSDEAGQNVITQEETVVAATGHTFSKTVAKASGCENAGNIEYYTCSACGKIYADAAGKTQLTKEQTVVAATGHTFSKTVAKAPGCESAGNIEYYTCSVCGKIYADAAGKTQITKEQTVKAATGHTFVWTAAKAPGCETTGNTGYYTCSVCGKIYADAAGKTQITKEQTAVAATGHTLAKTAAKAPACESAGNIEYYTCSACGKIYADAEGKTLLTKEQTVIAATGHSWDQGTITRYPTVSAAGIKKYTCTNDASHTKKETIPKLTKKEAEGDPSKKSTVAWAEKKIIASGGELSGSSAADLRLYSTAQKNKSITLKWNKVKGAEGYVLYGASCAKGDTVRRIKKITGGSTTTFTVKKLKKGTFYKYSLAAYKTVNGIETIIASSKLIYVVTKGGSLTNVSKVSASRKSISVLEGKTRKITATSVLQSETKKTKVYRKLRFSSSNTKIAAVNARTGKVTAKKAGTCYIYAYAQSGVYARIKVTVR